MTLNASEFVAAHAPDLDWLVEPTQRRLKEAWKIDLNHDPCTRAIRVYAIFQSDMDDKLKRSGVQVPCRAGCNICCTSHRILLTAVEVMMLVRYIHGLDAAKRDPIVRSILQTVHPTAEKSGVACALLDSAGCSAHSARPSGCRAYFSLSLAGCNAYASDVQQSEPETLAFPGVMFLALREMTEMHLRQRYEINSILRRIFLSDEKVAAWASGRITDEGDLDLANAI